ncbi:MAG TPA: transposase [Verrucomicrobiae bacterium]|nr:transposase [Verrucomicrobiae bacterium]
MRIEHVGGWYHITARGNERRNIFRDDHDRSHFLELLGEMAERFAVTLHCFVLMDNHYHLILELRQSNLSRALQWLNLSYSAWFNRRHERSGHLFQGRFKSILFNAAASALEVSRYVHLNPIRVGRLGLGKSERAAKHAGGSSAPDPQQIRERLQRLRSYRWSSYRAYIGLGACPPWLDRSDVVDTNRGTQAQQREYYRQYVESAVREGVNTAGLWAELKEGVILGSAQFVQRLRERFEGDRQEQRAAARLKAPRLTLPEVIAAVEKVKGQRWEAFRNRHGDGGRDMVLYLGRRRCGLTLRELETACGLGSYGVVAMAIRRYERKVIQDVAEAKLLNKINQMLRCGPNLALK